MGGFSVPGAYSRSMMRQQRADETAISNSDRRAWHMRKKKKRAYGISTIIIDAGDCCVGCRVKGGLDGAKGYFGLQEAWWRCGGGGAAKQAASFEGSGREWPSAARQIYGLVSGCFFFLLLGGESISCPFWPEFVVAIKRKGECGFVVGPKKRRERKQGDGTINSVARLLAGRLATGKVQTGGSSCDAASCIFRLSFSCLQGTRWANNLPTAGRQRRDRLEALFWGFFPGHVGAGRPAGGRSVRLKPRRHTAGPLS